MPVSAGTRRSPRVANGRDTSENNLVKARLPKLAGTPSSRRQYTYGSAMEPPPSRPGQQMGADEAVDISNAVGNVLEEQRRADPSRRNERAAPIRRTRIVEDADEWLQSEVSSQADSFDIQPDINSDDVPSFGTASSLAGHALVNSSPVALRVILEPPVRRRQLEPSPLRHVAAPPQSDDFSSPDHLSSILKDPSPSRPRKAVVSSKKVVIQSPTRQTSHQQTRRSQSVEDQDYRPGGSEDEEGESEEDTNVDQRDLNLSTTRRTPPRHRRSESVEDQAYAYENDEDDEDGEMDLAVPSKRKVLDTPVPKRTTAYARPTAQAKQTTTTLQQTDPPKGRRSTSGGPNNEVSTNGVAKTSARPAGAAKDSNGGPSSNLHVAREQVQITRPAISNFSQNINQRPRVQTKTEPNVDDSSDSPMRSQPYEGHWWFQRPRELAQSLTPSRLFRSRGPPVSEHGDSDASEVSSEEASRWKSPTWLWVFNPMTYIHALVRMWDGLMDRLFVAFDSLSSSLQHISPGRLSRALPFGLLGVALLLLAMLIPRLSVPQWTQQLERPAWSPSWPDLPLITTGLGKYVPSLSWGRQDNLWEFSEDDLKNADSLTAAVTKKLAMTQNSLNTHESSLKKVEEYLPKVIHMDRKDGKLVIQPDFFFGLLAMARDKGGFLTTNEKNEISSDKHRQAVSKAVTGHSEFGTGVDKYLSKRIGPEWAAWVKENGKKVDEVIRNTKQLQNAEGMSDEEFVKRLKAYAQEQNKALAKNKSEAGGLLVTREEFLRHVKEEFKSDVSAIRAEVKDLQPKLEQYMRENYKMLNETGTRPDTVSRAEIRALVQTQVHDAIASLNLKALAKHKIHAHLDIDIEKQINYFSPGNGATVNPKRSSSTYDPMRKGVAGYSRGINGARPNGVITALLPWHDEGDCWCAAREINERGNPHGAQIFVQLQHMVIPTHIVVEHTLASSTTDPGSRPRDMEVYIHIDDNDVLKRVQDLSANLFPSPETGSDWNHQAPNLPNGFVKIGNFTYSGNELHNGVDVHRLSPELLAMGAETEEVVVRAVNNHGDEDHTCFYRLRLYGQQVKRDAV